ncbi:MAG TPA: hypothetical protein VG871_14725 [Vicinamibacterales bacterium]|nr:hypothetical protein [Vicinamibacterales bacterium]
MSRAARRGTRAGPRAHQAGEHLPMHAPLPEVLRLQLREVADGQIDLPPLERGRELRRRNRDGAHGAVRGAGAQRVEHPGQERELPHVRQRQREHGRGGRRVEGVLAAEAFLQPVDERPRRPDERVRPRRRRDAGRDAHEERVVERLAQAAQRHADRRLAHAQRARGAAHAQLVVQRERDRQQVQIRRLHEGGLYTMPRHHGGACGSNTKNTKNTDDIGILRDLRVLGAKRPFVVFSQSMGASGSVDAPESRYSVCSTEYQGVGHSG